VSAGTHRLAARLWLLLLILSTGGCGGFMARRIAQAPNTYPTWFAPEARVLLAFDADSLTNFPAQLVEVGPPPARLQYRAVVPADYDVRFSRTNWVEHGHKRVQFNIRAAVPGRTNGWTSAPRGTVVLLHAYGEAEFAMAPWALRLAQEGWRCVLVDLRGHGQSTGKRISFGIAEARDLSQLLDALARGGELPAPVAVIGESYGAALALRWKAEEPRVGAAVAIAPYAVLSNAVLNIRREYAPLLPRALVKAGLRELPRVLEVPAGELDTTTVLARHPVPALFVAGAEDTITPAAEVRQLFEAVAPDSSLLVVPEATHETVPYFFDALLPPVLEWLAPGKAQHCGQN
jgi:pimeloyl-ACP methyl ester carboxylesterase